MFPPLLSPVQSAPFLVVTISLFVPILELPCKSYVLVSLVRSVSLSLGPAMRSMLLNVLLFIGHARAGGHAIEGLDGFNYIRQFSPNGVLLHYQTEHIYPYSIERF